MKKENPAPPVHKEGQALEDLVGMMEKKEVL